MSEIDADLDRSAAAFWLRMAEAGGVNKATALQQASSLLAEARAEARIPDSAKQPTLNDLEAPPLDILKGPSLTP